MSRILCTFPGKIGDILWALPTVRAVARTWNTPVDLAVAGEFHAALPLLQLGAPDYLSRVYALNTWAHTPPNEWLPPTENAWDGYDRVYHLGYRGWPQHPLAQETYQTLTRTYQHESTWAPLDLVHPWISWPIRSGPNSPALVVGFNDDWFELKVGLIELLGRQDIDGLPAGHVLTPAGSRWDVEAGFTPTTLSEAATFIQDAQVVLADCSALHVLAVAMGKRVLVFEPMEARWNPIFYPYGMGGSPDPAERVTVIKGNDGRPTFDARHTADYLRKAIARVRACVQ